MYSDPIRTPVSFASCLARLNPCTASSWSVVVTNQFGLMMGLSFALVELILTFPRDVVVRIATVNDA